MLKVISSKKLISLLSPIVLCVLSTQALALTPTTSIPKVPAGWKAHPPIHLKSPYATLVPSGLSPAQIQKAYGFPANFQGAGETIAIVDAYDDPNIESDLNTFSTQYGLPACTTANGCFTKVFTSGQPASNQLWAEEMSLDVEWAHAMAPQAKILLVEAENADNDLFNAISLAISLKPSVITISWGGGEYPSETSIDPLFQAGIPIFAAAGDEGEGPLYPAASPYVVGVGGTQLVLDSNGNYLGEFVWDDTGGGLSAYEVEPPFQKSYVIPQPQGMRGLPDVTFNATDYAIYDSFQEGGWLVVNGTSASTPIWASIVAVMKSAKQGNFANFNGSIYSVAREYSLNLLNDVSNGSNGSCGFYCTGRSGYDYVSGVGSPQVSNLINRFD